MNDHVIRVVERIDSFRAPLQNARTVHALTRPQQSQEMRTLAEASLGQNEEVKKISSWAAVLSAHTLVGTVYGMNFDQMPELHWAWGYPFALLLMFVFGHVLYRVVKRRRWL